MTAVQYPSGRTRILNLLTVVCVVGFFVMLYMALFYAGTDQAQGNVQRVFYVHVGAFSGGTISFFITVVAGIAYLVTRNMKWDQLALASVEVGLPLMTITLITGSIWARPIWNTWWTSDPRLNSMAVMWLLYAAYLTLRGSIENPERRARLAAVYGILAFLSVLYTTVVIRLRADTMHPVVVGPSPVEAQGEGGFEVRTDTHIGITMAVASIWWTLAAMTILWHRVRMENLADRVRELRAKLMSA